jgi:hypothetical protein
VPRVDLRLAVGKGAHLAEVRDLRPADLVHHHAPGEAERDHGGDAGARAERSKRLL